MMGTGGTSVSVQISGGPGGGSIRADAVDATVSVRGDGVSEWKACLAPQKAGTGYTVSVARYVIA